MSNYVTNEDLKNWDFFTPAKEPKIEKQPSPAKRVVVMREKPVLDVTPLPEEKPAPKPAIVRKPHLRTQNMETAVAVALGLVINLGMNISDMSSYAARAERRKAWHTFCLAVIILCPNYTVRGVDTQLKSLSIKNAPCRAVLGCMFENCRESPYTVEELKKKLESLI